MELRIGCSGWSYEGWVGPFYPMNAKPSSFLELYSRVFDTVEIDSTFYRIPKISTVKSWRDSTPDDFFFSPKFPKEITHEKELENVDRLLRMFIEPILNLSQKLGPVLIQLSPSFTFEHGFKRLKQFISDLPSNIHYAIEFRHDSWFRDEIYSLLQKSDMTLVWSEMPSVHVPKILTSSTAYLRMIGDRSIKEENFGTIQKDRTETIKIWADEIKNKEDEIEKAFVFSNNHFQGFSPATANLFRESLGLKIIDWNFGIRTASPERQKTLF